MTDERLCQDCGHVRNDHVAVCVECERLDQDQRYHPFEAAPSTDEGEERWERYVTTDKGTLWRSGATLSANVPAGVEAAIRAPLEERIRERDYTVNLLEAEASQFRTIIGRERAEVERLREALRTMLRAFDYWNATRGRDDESDERTFRTFLSTLAPLRLLATPPSSSTEGTDYWCGHDAHVPGDCPWAGTKEVEG